MKHFLLAAGLCAGLLFTGCGEDTGQQDTKLEPTKETRKTDNFDRNEAPVNMKPNTSADEDHDRTVEVAFTQPANVVNSLIRAANTGDFDTLSMICSKKGVDKGSPAWEICNLKAGTPEARKFQNKFKGAKISGDINVNGSFADVPIEYAGGKDRDVVRLSLEKGRWYLVQVRSYNMSR